MRRRLILVAFAFTAVAGLACWASRHLGTAPTYRGRTLRAWLEAVYQNPDSSEARRGLDHLIPIAVPYYARALGKQATAWDRAYSRFWHQLPEFFEDLLREPTPPEDLRIEAAQVLGFLGPPAHPAVPALVEAARAAEPGLRLCALEALGEIRADTGLVTPVFIAAFEDEVMGVRRAAAEGLAKLGPPAQPAVAVLTRELHDPEAQVRACAAWALCQVDHQTNLALGVWMETIKDPNGMARALSALYCGQLGAQAKSAVPALLVALHDLKPVREQAVIALQRIDPQAAAQAGIRP